MQRISDIKMSPYSSDSDLREVAARAINIKARNIGTFRIAKKSIDARNKNDIKIIYTVDISNEIEDLEPIEYPFINRQPDKRPIIIGSGPAGLVAGLMMSYAGLRPIIYERGADADGRKLNIDKFIQTGILNRESNIQFGEGGAGTFSDGKLNTLVKSPYNNTILRILVDNGAPEEILYLNKPHIGTDNLVEVVKNIRKRIISNGGEVHFNSFVKNIIINDNKVKGVEVNGNVVDSDIVLLAIGHSSRDTFEMLNTKGVHMEVKEFACGMRIEHPQELINISQFGKFRDVLPPADYKLVSHTPNGRSVYTFCMCPGGFVVPASSEDNHLCINGMSYYKRDNVNANSALLFNVNRKDFGSEHPLAGVQYQRMLESKAYQWGGGGYVAPTQKVGDYMSGNVSEAFGKVIPSYKPSIKMSPLHQFFPNDITDSVRFAIADMSKRLYGFDTVDATLTAVESRSSSPVRIVRGEDYMSVNTRGLYPVGEGCGYAGGIMSAAIDGMRVSAKIIEQFK